ncbi:MAG: amidotransferase 1, exosortase A system-associated [Gammaproteobacteria bacterium]|nr:amidotransferase 1, exosortase A system-associated [Gammaproteobacteria bacterium]
MCGISGIYFCNGHGEVDRELLLRMNASQFHRGPDEGGIHIEPGVGLGHRRLSIIDLNNGQQPLFNEDGSVVVVYNGEIYNFEELMKELMSLGHVFGSRCDTEVIVHAWEEWGQDCVKKFRGMFAFALWDRNKRTLFFARDRLGIKPLYYAFLPGNKLVFGSELKALMVHPELRREIDPQSVEDYFGFGYVPEPRTIFRDAKKLPPGHSLTVKVGESVSPRPQQYWDIPFQTTSLNHNHNETGIELIERLKEAVKIRLVADVPLGAFLSGGVDSSAVVAMMSELTNKPVNTCSISFGDPAFNEMQYAAQVAERYQTSHQVEEVDPNDFNLIDTLADLYDEPFADSSAIPTYRVCGLARKNVTVALSGDGGDENFAGYRRYQTYLAEERMRKIAPVGFRRPFFGLLSQLYPKANWAPHMFRAKSTFEALARDSVEGYFDRVALVRDPLRRHLFSPKFRSELQGYVATEVLRQHIDKCPTDHPLSTVQYLDIKTNLVGDILTKVDRASMAHGLEVRVPILDHYFVEWASGLPPEIKLDQGNGKHILKKALEPYLPNQILYRPKMGFAVPLGSWFRGPLRKRVRDTLLSSNLTDSGMFNQKFLQKLVTEHQESRRDHSAVIWSLLMFEAFQRRVLERPL